ncbi:MAG: M1 family peptidase, partial [Calditrichaeota bacterium]
FNKKELSGTARLSIKNHDGSNKLILDTNGLDIVSVTDRDGETPLPFHLGDSLKYLGRPLEITITPKTTEVVVYYHTRPGALALQWLEPDQTTSKQFPFLFTQSQAILARSWVPCQDTPGNKITYSATIKVAPPLRAVMSATPVQSDVENGVYRFRMDKPIPPYLIALAVGELEYRPLGPRSGVYAEPALIAKAAAEFRDTEKMIHIAEKLWGPYRWDRYDILVLPPSFPFGGMENARLTFVTPTVLAGDRSLVALIAHELSHSWSGNLVTCKVWNDFWLNEGFTTYLENRIMEELYGKDFAMMLSVLGYHDLLEEMEEMGTNSPDTRLKLSLEGRDPDEGLTGVPYEKGRLFLTLLENAFGRQKWDAFLKSYFDKYAFQAITTEDFLNYLNQQLIKGNQELQSLLMINQWVYESGLPENCPIPESREFARVEREVEKWLNGMPAIKINSENWTALHWLHFLRSLPPTLSQEQMKELDDTFHFTQSQNSEILFVWLKLSIHNHYSAADSTLQNFLMTVGRRKFVLPLYKEMIKTEKGKQRAREIYLKARSHYHPVTYLSIDPLLDVSG